MQPFSEGCFHRLGCALYQQQPLQRFARGRVVLLVVVESSWSYPAFVLFLFFKYFVPSSASPLEGDDPLLWTRVSSSRGSCHPLLSFLPLSNCEISTGIPCRSFPLLSTRSAVVQEFRPTHWMPLGQGLAEVSRSESSHSHLSQTRPM